MKAEMLCAKKLAGIELYFLKADIYKMKYICNYHQIIGADLR